jgi:hypothetical protein
VSHIDHKIGCVKTGVYPTADLPAAVTPNRTEPRRSRTEAVSGIGKPNEWQPVPGLMFASVQQHREQLAS